VLAGSFLFSLGNISAVSAAPEVVANIEAHSFHFSEDELKNVTTDLASKDEYVAIFEDEALKKSLKEKNEIGASSKDELEAILEKTIQSFITTRQTIIPELITDQLLVFNFSSLSPEIMQKLTKAGIKLSYSDISDDKALIDYLSRNLKLKEIPYGKSYSVYRKDVSDRLAQKVEGGQFKSYLEFRISSDYYLLQQTFQDKLKEKIGDNYYISNDQLTNDLIAYYKSLNPQSGNLLDKTMVSQFFNKEATSAKIQGLLSAYAKKREADINAQVDQATSEFLLTLKGVLLKEDYEASRKTYIEGLRDKEEYFETGKAETQSKIKSGFLTDLNNIKVNTQKYILGTGVNYLQSQSVTCDNTDDRCQAIDIASRDNDFKNPLEAAIVSYITSQDRAASERIFPKAEIDQLVSTEIFEDSIYSSVNNYVKADFLTFSGLFDDAVFKADIKYMNELLNNAKFRSNFLKSVYRHAFLPGTSVTARRNQVNNVIVYQDILDDSSSETLITYLRGISTKDRKELENATRIKNVKDWTPTVINIVVSVGKAFIH